MISKRLPKVGNLFFLFSVQNMHDNYSPKILTVFWRKTDGKWSAFHLVVESLLIGWLTLTAPKV